MKKSILLSFIALLLLYIAYAQITTALPKKLFLQAYDEIVIQTGDASITMKKDGSIFIKGQNLQIEGSKSVNVKASGEMILKGSKIKDN